MLRGSEPGGGHYDSNFNSISLEFVFVGDNSWWISSGTFEMKIEVEFYKLTLIFLRLHASKFVSMNHLQLFC